MEEEKCFRLFPIFLTTCTDWLVVLGTGKRPGAGEPSNMEETDRDSDLDREGEEMDVACEPSYVDFGGSENGEDAAIAMFATQRSLVFLD